MAGYIGVQPLSEAVQSRAAYTATAGQTSFSTTYQPGFVDVYLNGIHLLNATDYTATNGTDIVLTTGATVGQILEVVALTTFYAHGSPTLPFYKADGTSDTITIVSREFPFFNANGAPDNIGV